MDSTGATGSATNPVLSDNWSASNPPRQGQEQKLLDVPTTSLEAVFMDDPTSNDVNGDKNVNNDGFHEIIEEADLNTTHTNNANGGTDPLQVDSTTSDRLANNADYRINIDSNNATPPVQTITIYKGSSTTPLS